MFAPLIATLSIPFAGGDVSQLAKAISDATKQGVVFEAGAQERVGAFEFTVEDVNELTRVVLASTGFKRAPGPRHAFHHGRLGSWNFGVAGVGRVVNHSAWRRASASLPENFLNDGNVTLRSAQNEAFGFNALPTNLLSKPLQVHWLLEGSAFKASVSNMPAEEFLNHLAKAAGGVLLTRQDRFVLNFDAAEIQRRALATLAEVQKNKGYARLSTREQFEVELSRAGLASLSSATLSQLLTNRNGTYRFEIPAGMRPGIYAYVTAMLNGTAQESEATQRFSGLDAEQVAIRLVESSVQQQHQESVLRDLMTQRGGRNSNSRLMRIDPRIWGIAEIDARFRVSVQVATVPDAQGRQGPPVRLP